MIADSITVSRILFSLCLFVISPSSVLFAVLYLLCGVTDVLDGFIARRLHTESREGEMLDSIADLFFTVAYAVRILPLLSLPAWIWIWTALIAIVKIPGILKRSQKKQRFSIEHSIANKVTGLLIFLLPLINRLFDSKYCAAAVCLTATVAAMRELFGSKNNN